MDKNILIRFFVVLTLITLVVAMASYQFGHPQIGIDDANIFFVYAKHLSQGHGVVYNIGQERVEGISSWLWLGIVSLVFRVCPNPERCLLLITVLMLATQITIVTLFLDWLYPPGTPDKRRYFSFSSLVYVIMICLTPTYIVWMTLSLMDIGLWSFLLTLTTIVVLWNSFNRVPRFSGKFSLLIGLLLLARPEAMLWAATFIAIAWMQRFFQTDCQNAGNDIRWPVRIYILTLIAMTGCRVMYFGYPLPNTFYAKVSPSLSYNLSQGMHYILGYFGTGFIVECCLFAVLLSFGFGFFGILEMMERKTAGTHSPHPLSGQLYITSSLCLIGLFIPVVTGGDHFGSYRFYQAIFPLLVLHTLVFWKNYTSQSLRQSFSAPQRTIVLVTLVFFTITSYTQTTTWKNVASTSRLAHEFNIAEEGRQLGKFMGKLFSDLEKYPSVGVIAAGGSKFSYPGAVIDLMGLNNTQMGHSPGARKGIKNHAAFNKETFLQLSPEIVEPTIITKVDERAPFDHSDNIHRSKKYLKGLYQENEFLAIYAYARISTSVQQGKFLQGFFAKKFLAMLSHHSQYLVEIEPANRRNKETDVCCMP